MFTPENPSFTIIIRYKSGVKGNLYTWALQFEKTIHSIEMFGLFIAVFKFAFLKANTVHHTGTWLNDLSRVTRKPVLGFSDQV